MEDNNTNLSIDPSIEQQNADKNNIIPINSESQVINDFNKVYTTLVHGGKNYVLRHNTDAFGHNYLEFFNQKEFIDAHRDSEKLEIQITKENGDRATKLVNPAKYWLESPESHSSKYGLTFHPIETKFHRGKLNTYMGRGCEPMECEKSDVEIYLRHVYKIICNGDKNSYEYVIQWLAHLIQKPEEKPEVAIVLKAGQGTGKGTFVDPIGKIIGSHYLHAQSPEQVIGKFNAQLENKLLVFADEFFAGSKGSTDRLKTMITERLNTIERKGQDRISVPCFARIIMATNHENVIKIERDERRYLYLEVSEEKKQNREYFNALHNAIKDPDFPSKLYHYLKNLDISEFEPRNVPKTDALTQQKIDNLEPLDKWLYTILLEGGFSINVPWPKRLPNADIEQHAEEWLKAHDLKVWGDVKIKIGKLLIRLGAVDSRPRTQGGGRQRCKEFPDIDKIRDSFSEYINADLKW
ncbi:primase-helicase family protein [uncultured Shewanella sp.]|uniref:primase-helicase family protein n=1 Tax=uncultured Shewanella sp. TaxID=173975 RepID=UPI00263A184C|nr:primase-helicase family protein [uncultured Shewanella sp.]